MQILDIENLDNKQLISENEFYIFLKTLKNDLLIGPFDCFECADEYMKTKTSNMVQNKYIIDGKHLKQLL